MFGNSAMTVHELHYSRTNTYLIEGDKGNVLFDTGWAGTFPAFRRCVRRLGVPVQRIAYILLSHIHPDHVGIAQEIADCGPVIVVPDAQRSFLHNADGIFEKENSRSFKPIRDERVRFIDLRDSRAFLQELGIDGEVLHTPGHSDDSISLCLDDGTLLVGDLNPLYELDLHRGTTIEESWNRLLARNPTRICYGHAKTVELNNGKEKEPEGFHPDLYQTVSKIVRLIDKGMDLERIQKKTGADPTFIEDVARMYRTHQNVGIQGILDRIEIKER